MLDRLLSALGIKKPAKRVATPAADQTPTPSAPAKPRPVHVSDEEFDRVILGSDRLAVVDFWADWCGPCHLMAPHMDFLAEDYGERILVAKLDVDENPTTPARYNIMGIPTVIFFQDGQVVDRHTGVLTVDQLSERVEKLLA